MKPNIEARIPCRSRVYDFVQKTGLKASQITQDRRHGHNMACDWGTVPSGNVRSQLKKFVYESNNLSVIEIEPKTRSQFKPNHTSSWVGSHSDLVKLATKPALPNDVCTNNECPLAVCNDSPLPHPPSRTTTILSPLTLQNFTRGLRHLVKM